MKIALSQMNPTVGDLSGNKRKILAFYRRAVARGADLVVMPELCLTGYPPQDLLERSDFIDRQRAALDAIAARTGRTGLLVGFVDRNPSPRQKQLHNSVALLHRGKIAAVRHKRLLPTYDVFDEARHFAPGPTQAPVPFAGRRLGLLICEDMWHVPSVWPESPYHRNPVAELARAGADLFINISSSPFHRGKTRVRHDLVRHHALAHRRPFIFVNQAGGNDELLFDGHSLVFDGKGQCRYQAPGFEETLGIIDLDRAPACVWIDEPEINQVCDALTMGLRDYVHKTGFKKVVLGLSGGIDSAVTAALAVRALGASNVTGVLMPSEFSSRGSIEDALTLARRLGIRTHRLPITPAFSILKKTLRPAFRGAKPDVTEENLQARIRGTLLMAISNKTGALVLTTGNKSELSMGYCTLYGDMNGGLAVISDVPKTLVYRIGRRLNEPRWVIPEASFTKPPSAELRPDQTDQDSLPPYEVLDGILEAYVENGEGLEMIVRRGYSQDLVEKVLRTVDRNEYKRRQAAPGLRISAKAFGPGRRYPLARGSYRPPQ